MGDEKIKRNKTTPQKCGVDSTFTESTVKSWKGNTPKESWSDTAKAGTTVKLYAVHWKSAILPKSCSACHFFKANLETQLRSRASEAAVTHAEQVFRLPG